jgi:hypothetical protein
MTASILDGRSKFDCSLAEFYVRHDIAQAAARNGVLVPPVGHPAPGDEPALAIVTPWENAARWVARCPCCPGGAAYVWLDCPIMFCIACGNQDIGGRWRAIVLPPNPGEIATLLVQRPRLINRYWSPGESVEQLRAENEALGV